MHCKFFNLVISFISLGIAYKSYIAISSLLKAKLLCRTFMMGAQVSEEESSDEERFSTRVFIMFDFLAVIAERGVVIGLSMKVSASSNPCWVHMCSIKYSKRNGTRKRGYMSDCMSIKSSSMWKLVRHWNKEQVCGLGIIYLFCKTLQQTKN